MARFLRLEFSATGGLHQHARAQRVGTLSACLGGVVNSKTFFLRLPSFLEFSRFFIIIQCFSDFSSCFSMFNHFSLIVFMVVPPFASLSLFS